MNKYTPHNCCRLMGAVDHVLAARRHYPWLLDDKLAKLEALMAEMDSARDTSLGMRAEDVG